jgi:hypothetical protein
MASRSQHRTMRAISHRMARSLVDVGADQLGHVADGTASAIEGPRSSAEAWLDESDLLVEGKERQTHYPLDPNATIAAAFKAAGLPVPEIPAAQPGATPRVLPDPIIVAALKAAGLARK